MNEDDDDKTRVATQPAARVGRSKATVIGRNALPSGYVLGSFEIESVIGEGGFSIVYLAHDRQLDRQTALKEYMPASLAVRLPDMGIAARSERVREAFEAGLRSFVNEAQVLAHFDHPALAKVFRFWEQRGTAYMAMPYYEGVTLKQVLQKSNEPPAEAWLHWIFGPLLDAIELLHKENCFHRDIAPDNIMILGGSSPLLLDFGAARHVIADMTQELTAILKPGYAPIEQYADVVAMRQGAWTDIYAIAAVLYRAVTGRVPTASVGRMLSDDLRPAAEAALRSYSPQLLAGIQAGLIVKPQERPQSIAEFRRLLGYASAPPPRPVSVSEAEAPTLPARFQQAPAVKQRPPVLAPKDVAPPPAERDTVSEAEAPTRRPAPLPRGSAVKKPLPVVAPKDVVPPPAARDAPSEPETATLRPALQQVPTVQEPPPALAPKDVVPPAARHTPSEGETATLRPAPLQQVPTVQEPPPALAPKDVAPTPAERDVKSEAEAPTLRPPPLQRVPTVKGPLPVWAPEPSAPPIAERGALSEAEAPTLRPPPSPRVPTIKGPVPVLVPEESASAPAERDETARPAAVPRVRWRYVLWGGLVISAIATAWVVLSPLAKVEKGGAPPVPPVPPPVVAPPAAPPVLPEPPPIITKRPTEPPSTISKPPTEPPSTIPKPPPLKPPATPQANAGVAPPPLKPKPRQDPACVELMERLSLGEDTPELRALSQSLHCK